MTFVAQELPQFSIKRSILQNVLNFSNFRWWPIKNTSVAHRLRNPVLDVHLRWLFRELNPSVNCKESFLRVALIGLLFHRNSNYWLKVVHVISGLSIVTLGHVKLGRKGNYQQKEKNSARTGINQTTCPTAYLLRNTLR